MNREASTHNRCKDLLKANRKRQAGLSLVELMIGMVIGLVLLGGVMQTMLASKEASTARQSMATVTDNARFLFEFMARDLRMTGRGYSAASLPLSYANDTLTVGYIVPNASGIAQTVLASFSLNNSNQIVYSRSENGAAAIGGVLIDGVDDFDVSFGVLSGSDINYTAYGTAPGSMDQVVGIRTRVSFSDVTNGSFTFNAASTPMYSTVALRNRISDLMN